MRRSSTELERDIVEYLLAKYEETDRAAVVRLLQSWLEECNPQRRRASTAPRGREGLLQWIDRNALRFGVTDSDLRDIGLSVRTLLQSLATPSGGFVCA
ncbi:MAG: hypothetical protein ACOY5F_13265 [Pseudomonadota bacterium]